MSGSSVERRGSAEEAMSFFQRITRALHILPTIERDGQSRFEDLGASYAEQVLDDERAICITNPVIPQRKAVAHYSLLWTRSVWSTSNELIEPSRAAHSARSANR